MKIEFLRKKMEKGELENHSLISKTIEAPAESFDLLEFSSKFEWVRYGDNVENLIGYYGEKEYAEIVKGVCFRKQKPPPLVSTTHLVSRRWEWVMYPLNANGEKLKTQFVEESLVPYYKYVKTKDLKKKFIRNII